MKTTINQSANKTIELLNNNGLSIAFHPNGKLEEIIHNSLMINLYRGNRHEKGIMNIFLRHFYNNKIHYYPLLDENSLEKIEQLSETQMLFQGVIKKITYQIICTVDKKHNLWTWSVAVNNHQEQELNYDLVYVQDIGIASPGQIRTNEAYTSQYIDHHALVHPDYGYVLASRQNMPQDIGGKIANPWILQGSFTKVTDFVSDGFKLYDLEYKQDNQIHGLLAENLGTNISQYELSLIALQLERQQLPSSGSQTHHFYAIFETSHNQASSEQDLMLIDKATQLVTSVIFPSYEHNITAPGHAPAVTLLHCHKLTHDECDKYFTGSWRNEEKANGRLLSFFYTPQSCANEISRHVILDAKELAVERPHGHIIFSGCNNNYQESRLTSTSYMYGIFNSQLTYGNTSFNKLLSVSRTHLNIHKFSGQRIFFRDQQNQIYQLGLPSAYEIGVNSTRWVYRFADECIEITTWSDSISPQIYLSLNSTRAYEFFITHEIVGGVNEDDSKPQIQITADNSVLVRPDKKELVTTHFPNSFFKIRATDPTLIENIQNDEWLTNLPAATAPAFITLKTKPVTAVKLIISGYESNQQEITVSANPENQINIFENMWHDKLNGFKLSHPQQTEVVKLNDLSFWYLHNAMIHYLVPHGLEQYSGAAWGTRDVCQGPVELFLALGDFPTIRNILLTLYVHQYVETGGWPQWFMFDQFYKLQQHESHGDVIVWPLKAVCDYVEASGDYSIFEELLSYTHFTTGEFTAEKYSLLEHIQHQLDNIESNFVPGTHLLSYGDGDWDDTLQPANAELRKSMVSGWTVQLAYQTLRRFAIIMENSHQELAAKLSLWTKELHQDYNQKIIKNGVSCGFIRFDSSGTNTIPLLHPEDNNTGIHYRLLPMTRGMISEIFDAAQVQKHYHLIHEHLYYSDGVRLMDKPAPYSGGPNYIFKRAEQAANVGREIGLQYVHAHIRYVEAMAKIGKPEHAYYGLQQINPILINQVVPNAQTRQSNCYFSSSDAQFESRYQAQQQWNELHSAQIPVRGGWRIYSSGPGIYLNQLIRNVLGIRIYQDRLEIDPVLPPTLSGLTFNYKIWGHNFVFNYHIEKTGFAARKICHNNKELSFKRNHNLYRTGACVVSRNTLTLTSGSKNIIDIYL